MPDLTRGSPPPILYLPRPSTWLTWHDYLFKPGMRVLDLACGEGRHALTVAQRGAVVTAVDCDESRLETGREAAGRLGVEVNWQCVDLTGEWPDFGVFDAVLVFNYLDRARMPEIRDRVAPGGLLVMETYLQWQRALGWGPTDDRHLLAPGELARLTAPLETLHGREVFEPVENNKVRAVASIVAQKRVEG
ncbi:MAG TPA: class I SAM-dependent methyltransferase [Gemmatimonadales bacterium]|jgi:2-polyprenyl-3-methyl-5-hydroxy-6-metoxy-1,4-benzoquinol methylase|nr:class I SAM-dependent methyltransferase [Gemmatimonadales bacterium]